MAEKLAYKEEDLVRRVSGNGGFGVVKSIKAETASHSSTTKVAKYLVNVLWDNGTFSYLAPEALVKAEKRE